MKALILSSLHDATGNLTTAKRIQLILRDCSVHSTLVDPDTCDLQKVANEIELRKYDLVVGIHICRASKVLSFLTDGCIQSIRLFLVLGGTDINHNLTLAATKETFYPSSSSKLDHNFQDANVDSDLEYLLLQEGSANEDNSRLIEKLRCLFYAERVVSFSRAMALRYWSFWWNIDLAIRRVMAGDQLKEVHLQLSPGDTACLDDGEFLCASCMERQSSFDNICMPCRRMKKVIVIPQSVASLDMPSVSEGTPGNSSCFPWGQGIHNALGIPSHVKILLLICSLRSVKDPLFLVEHFKEWHCQDNSVAFVIVGPTLDIAVAQLVQKATGAVEGLFSEIPNSFLERRLTHLSQNTYQKISQNAHAKDSANPMNNSIITHYSVTNVFGGCGGVYYSPPVPHSVLQNWIAESAIVLNTSLSEGQSGSILESMSLGTPVVARNNEGNASLIVHQQTGLLFDCSDPSDAIEHCKSLLYPPAIPLLEGSGMREDLRVEVSDKRYFTLRAQDIARNAMRFVRERHSMSMEQQAWKKLLL